MTSPRGTTRAHLAIGSEQTAKRVVDLLTKLAEGDRGRGHGPRKGGRWHVSRCISPNRRTRTPSANWSVSPPATRPQVMSPSTPSRPRTGRRRRRRNWSRSPPAVSSCTAGTTAQRAATISASRSRRRSRSVPVITAPREAVCCCSTRCCSPHRPRRVLDLGTGTGVLAIAAAEAACRIKVLASDIDPLSVKVAAENAHLNRHRRLGRDNAGDRVFGAAIRKPWAVDPAIREYPRQSVAANGNADGADLAPSALVILLRCRITAESVIAAYLGRADWCWCVRSGVVRLEQPLDALCEVNVYFGAVAGDDALFAALDARLGEPVGI